MNKYEMLYILNPELSDEAREAVIAKLQKISDKFNVDFVISASMDKDTMPEKVQELVSVAL